MYNFTNLILSHVANLPQRVTLTAYSDTYSRLQPIKLSLYLRACIEGEAMSESDQVCKKCERGTYSYVKGDKVCKDCPFKVAVCFGGQVVAPLPGYWRSSKTSENFMECPNSDVCIGGNETQPLGRCKEGYSGILCGECSENYSLKEEFKCERCLGHQSNII